MSREVTVRVVPDLDRARERASESAARRVADLEVLAATGIDYLCDEVMRGVLVTTIADELGVLPSSIVFWLASEPSRSRRLVEARKLSALLSVEKAELSLLLAGADRDQVARAKARGEHYRWLAARLDPETYGDRIRQDITTPETPEQIEARLASLLDEIKGTK